MRHNSITALRQMWEMTGPYCVRVVASPMNRQIFIGMMDLRGASKNDMTTTTFVVYKTKAEAEANLNKAALRFLRKCPEIPVTGTRYLIPGEVGANVELY